MTKLLTFVLVLTMVITSLPAQTFADYYEEYDCETVSTYTEENEEYEYVLYESEDYDYLYDFDTELESECGEFVFIFVPSDRDGYEDYLYYSDFDFDGDYIGIEPLSTTTRVVDWAFPFTTINTNWSGTAFGPTFLIGPNRPASVQRMQVASGWRIDTRWESFTTPPNGQETLHITVVRTGGPFTIPTVATLIGRVVATEYHAVPALQRVVDTRIYIRRASPARTVNFDPTGGTWPAPANSQGVLSRTLASGQDNYTSVLNTDNFTLRNGDQNPPQRPGYEFLGWFTTAETGGERVLRTSAAPAGGHTLYARWEADTGNGYDFHIIFNMYDGSDDYVPVGVNLGDTLSLTELEALGIPVSHVLSAAGAPGWALWGWFDGDTLDASGRTRTVGSDTFRRPVVGAQGFDLTAQLTDCMFDTDGNLHLYLIWSLWGDTNDDDDVTVADVTLIEEYLFDMSMILLGLPAYFNNPINIHAGMVTIGAELSVADVTRIQEYLFDQSMILLGLPAYFNAVLGQP